MWVMPNPSKVKGTAGMCTSTTKAANGKCGSYYCNVDKATLTPEINPAKPCGHDDKNVTNQAVYDYVCEASLPDVVTKCAGMFTADAVLNPAGFKTKTNDCVKMDPSVTGKGVTQQCLDCFAEVAFCCAADTLGCALTCSGGASKECDDAQKAAGCVNPLFVCAGLPNPL